MTAILEEINRIFELARSRIESFETADGIPYRDFVLILDNLEKIRNQHYGKSFVLPMIKVVTRQDRKPFHAGIQSLKDLLGRRLKEHSLNDVFTPEALDFLIRYSGGHARQLMTSVQNACTYTGALPITLSAAQRAIAQTISLYSTSIDDSYWIKLAELDRSPNQQIVNGDKDYLAMLEGLSVLEYLNGGTEEDWSSPAEPWYAVNPVVRELRRFKDARAVVGQIRGAE